MKVSSMDTHMGNISIDQEVIAQYAGTIAMECFGVVGMANMNVRDGLVRLLKKDNMTRGIQVILNNNKLTLNFHIIVSYGVSILAVSDNLISSVKYKVEEFTGIEVEKMNIYVEGVKVIDEGRTVRWFQIRLMPKRWRNYSWPAQRILKVRKNGSMS